ncbi:MAG: valine--tRNA ligase [Pseudomonadota bacterium]
MEKTFDPQAIEKDCYARWEADGCFAPSGSGEPYCIMIPPPNVTGTLHMGHAFQDTIMDALTRYHRMAGRDTLWQMGTDHAGIATQMVVERQLNAEGKSKHDLGRDAFIERVWKWKGESGGAIGEQLRRLGASVDWTRERFTMEPALSKAVTEVFVKLHEDGLIYRGKRLVNWDPVLHTALSDLEVVSTEESGHLWHLRYPLSDGSGQVIVATTRPETMLGDVAVAVHPEDERYTHLIGKTIDLPLTDRKIPVIADDYVDPEFGSGCVKITPAHDFNDYEIGKRHGLEMITVLDFDAKLNDAVPETYQGLPRFEARKRIVADLDAAGLLERIDDHKSAVPRGDRSGEVLEPLLTDQWYVSAKPLADPAIDAVKSGRIRFVPANWDRTYYEWMNNIQDWCISRQLWWGHRIPAWYTEDGEVIVARSEEEARAKAGLSADAPLRQDDDVLDTWFSSALWPFATLGWPEKTPELQRYYPTSVLVTGFDIIFFWVARMVMMGLRFMDDVPFHEIYIHGLVRDSDGQKMSKSKGNVLDPLDLIDGTTLDALLEKRTSKLMQPAMAKAIEKTTRKQFPDGIPAFGTDALRFTFMAMATTGRDIRFDMGRIEGYRNFCNKLWNATRYVLMNCEDKPRGGEDMVLADADLWIRSRLHRTIREVQENFATYRFDLASQALYEFTWNEFCDWYLELTKPILRDADDHSPEARGTRWAMLDVLEALLRALHPMMPFITDELWRRVAPLVERGADTVMSQPYPEAGNYVRDLDAERNMDWVTDFVLGIRQIRGEMDISPSRALPAVLQDASDADRERLGRYAALLSRLANLEQIDVLDAGAVPDLSATALLGDMRLCVPLEGLVDIGAEIARLEKQLAKQRSEHQKVSAKLGNAKFVDRAPADVVEEQRRRGAELERLVAKLEDQLGALRKAGV